MADPKNYQVVVPFENDAGKFRVSTLGGPLDDDAGNNRVSAIQEDGALLRTSSLNAPIATYFQNSFHVGTTDSAVVSGVAGQTIRIYAINLTQNSAGATKWTGGGADLQGITIVGASAGYVMSVNPPAFLLKTTSAGTDLELALSGTISAGGWVNGWTE